MRLLSTEESYQMLDDQNKLDGWLNGHAVPATLLVRFGLSSEATSRGVAFGWVPRFALRCSFGKSAHLGDRVD